ncbi:MULTISPECIES: cell division protein FtsQ/DivIB [Luteibacter]|uniref:Cell division protein FtsQ n=1 Tax=Luteibacter flocculans TaxID=2780091 RepID=A0ABY4T052_9GAMM|nr:MULTISPECIES: cell division protein FtsQ/DivIB [Luteibacter]URL57951.1 cell division protein FtsQ/DivIB [Luteibacter flocculans]SFW42952.1 cell division protein FtsQ [Luteibacter sp. UNCMF366Tsu5.1]
MKGAAATRIVAWGIAITLVVLPVVGVMQGWFAAGRWPVTQLKVEAEFAHVSAEQIRSAVLPSLGKGFFATDLEDVRHAIGSLPWVESVEVRKRWPDTLLVRIYERQPFARWNENRLISRQGLVFDAPGADQMGDLPRLSGPDSRLAEVVSFYAQARKAFEGRAQLSIVGVSLSERGSWSVTTDSGAQIVIGDRDQADRRLARFLDVYPQLVAGRHGGFAYADLRYTNGFAIRWPDTATTATPKVGS